MRRRVSSSHYLAVLPSAVITSTETFAALQLGVDGSLAHTWLTYIKLPELSNGAARIRLLAKLPESSVLQHRDGPRSGPRSPARLKQPDPEQDSRGIFVHEKLLG